MKSSTNNTNLKKIKNISLCKNIISNNCYQSAICKKLQASGGVSGITEYVNYPDKELPTADEKKSKCY